MSWRGTRPRRTDFARLPAGGSIDLCASLKRAPGTLQNVASLSAGQRVVDGPPRRDHAGITIHLQHDDLFRVSQDRDVRVVRDDYDLPALFCSPQDWDERAVDKLTVEVVFWLVDDERIVTIRREQESQQDRLLLPKRKATEFTRQVPFLVALHDLLGDVQLRPVVYLAPLQRIFNFR